jgi:hypothetical protein
MNLSPSKEKETTIIPIDNKGRAEASSEFTLVLNSIDPYSARSSFEINPTGPRNHKSI